jgi:hypothetical protein
MILVGKKYSIVEELLALRDRKSPSGSVTS